MDGRGTCLVSTWRAASPQWGATSSHHDLTPCTEQGEGQQDTVLNWVEWEGAQALPPSVHSWKESVHSWKASSSPPAPVGAF